MHIHTYTRKHTQQIYQVSLPTISFILFISSTLYQKHKINNQINKQVSGLPESAQPRINLQLSSPIESKTITKIYDPLDDEEKKDDVDATADTTPAIDSDDIKEKGGDDEEQVTEVVKEEETGEDEIEADAKDTEEEKGEENAEEEKAVEEKTEVEEETPEVVEGEEKEKTEVVEEEETPVIVEAEEEKTEVEKEAPAVVEKEKTEIETKKEYSHVIFEGVDASIATLTVDLSDLDIPLGSSATYDLAPLCEIDVLGGVTKKITDLKVAIVPDEIMTSFATAACFEDNVEVDTGADAVIEENESESEDFQDAVSEEGEAPDKADDGVKVEGVPTDDAAAATQDDGDTTEKKENGEKEEKETSDQVDVEESAEEEETKEVVSEEAQEPEQVEEAKQVATDEAPAETSEEIKKEETTEQEETTETETETKEEVAEVEKTPSPEEEGPSIILPTCVLDLTIEYNASTKDQILILTEKYNAAVARHAVAVDKLRKIGVAVRRAKIAAAASSQLATIDNKKPAVKPGFLNKKPKKKEAMFYVRWYEKTLGPNSLFRKVYPIAKNYVLFFGGVLLMHFQGHQLALPPPV